MPRSKLRKFNELSRSPHVLEMRELALADKLKKIIGQAKTITLELGCGRAEYSLALAQMRPRELFIGLDIQGERLWYAAQTIANHKVKNVLLLRMPVEKIKQYLPEKSINHIWLTFPDPYPKKKQAKKRLTAPSFLEIYKKILKTNGTIKLKTDDYNFFLYSLENMKLLGAKLQAKIIDIYGQTKLLKTLAIPTYFEEKHRAQGKKIYFASWKLIN